MAVPQVIIDIGIEGGPYLTGTELVLGDAMRGLLGTGTLGSDFIWVDVSEYVRSWTFRRGASRGDGPVLRYDAGTCSIDFNNADRRFDPTNLAGPYVLSGESMIQPMIRVRIRALWDGTTYNLFYGYADQWSLDYQANSWSTVTLTASDASKILTSYSRGDSSPVGAGELSGARVNRILNSIDWPAADRDIATGNTTMQATTLGGDALTELQLVQDSEQGQFYIGANGRAVWRNRQAMWLEARSAASQATFGDGGYVATGELPYAEVTIDTDDQDMANLVTIGRAGGTPVVAEDASSRQKYLTRTYEKTDLLFTTDAEATMWANSLLFQSATPELRFAGMSVNRPRPDLEDTLWPELLGREFGDRITVIRRPPGGGDPIERDVFVQGVEITSDGMAWTTRFTFQSAGRFAYWVLGDPVLGKLGENAIAY